MTHKIILNDVFKGYTLDQDKIFPPEETVRRFKERLKKVRLDILEGTVRIDNGRLGVPVYFSICGKDAELTIGTKKQMGKGGTPHQAEASAVMELAERFSFFSFGRNPKNFIIEKYRNLIKDHTLSFDSIALSVHDDSEDLGKAREVFSSLPLKWTWGYNLTRNQEMLVPFDWFRTINEFNGPSAGNCAEEAILQGICEVVERHVSSVISRNKMKTDALDLDTATDTLVSRVIRNYRNAGVQLHVSDFSLDTGIPTVGVLAYDPTTFPEKSEIVWTAGTTPDPQKSLSRALTEVAQLAGDFNTRSNYVASGLPKFRNLDEAHFIIHPEEKKGIFTLPNLSNDNIKIEIENCLSALSCVGLEVIAIDIMHPGLKIPAFYTIIPGAHFRERATGTSVGMFAAKILTENHPPERAVLELSRMDALMPGKYYLKFFLGSCYLALNEPEKGLKILDTALALEPKDQDIPSIYSYMAQCLKEMGKYREAIKMLEKAERLDKERTDIYNLMGFCHFKLKEHEKAIECFQKVLELDPSSAIDYANIASNYRDMGKKEAAITYYRLALEMDPTIDFARESLNRLQE